MLGFHSNTDNLFTSYNVPEPEKSKIPFIFAAVPHELFEKDLDASAIGVYCAIAKFVNLKAQTKIGDRKVLVGITIPVSQQRIADIANTSRRTVIRKIQQLVEADIIECKKSYRGCYVYQLTIYQEKIEELEREFEVHQSDENTKRTSRPNYTSPGVPTGEQCDEFAADSNTTEDRRTRRNQSNNAGKSQTHAHDNQPSDDGVTSWQRVCEDLAHIKDFLRNLKKYNSPPKSPPSDDSTSDDNDDSWREFEKYAVAFYGTIRSQKFLKEVCLYFKEKVDEYGIADDGFNDVWEMIPILLRAGARHHKAYDQPFGIKAFDKVIDDRERKRKQQQQREQWEQQQSSSSEQSSNSSDDSSNHSDNPRQSNKQQSSPNDVPPHRPKTAKEAIARYLISRHCLVKIGVKEPYSEKEIDELWLEAYDKYDAPDSPDQWVEDRIHVRQRLWEKGICEFYTDEEIEDLKRKATQIVGS